MTGHAYGQPTPSKARRWSATDRRYSSYRWRKTREIVLRRDMKRCWVEGCIRPGNVCDHIRAVYPGMPDAEFYDLANLRASCRGHNLARGFARPEHEAQLGMRARSPLSGVVTRDYSKPTPKVY